MKPLYGHTSPDTAYVVDDYPYGFRLRCKIRYWIEKHAKKGYRLVSQTTNPKQPIEVWNKPKASTYSLVAMALFLDENGHVQAERIHEYSTAEDALAFVRHFPLAPLADLRTWALMKAKFDEKMSTGEVYFTIGGVKQEESDESKAQHAAKAATWRAVADAIQALGDTSTACKVGHDECIANVEIAQRCGAHQMGARA